MKRLVLMFIPALICGVMFVSCDTDIEESKDIDSKGFRVYWVHQVFNEQGRGFIFEFYAVERSDILYQLQFDYQIDNNRKSIDITLVGKIDKGKCPLFPCPDVFCDDLCTSKGNFFIPEDMVNEGNYTVTVNTSSYSVQSEMIFTKEKAVWKIPENKYLSSELTESSIAPKNLLHGAVVISGAENKKFVFDFLDDIRALGLKDTIYPPESGKPVIETWPPDNHSIPFSFSMTAKFSTVVELAIEHYHKNPVLNIYLFSTNGDQARTDFQGIMYWCSERKTFIYL